MKQKTVDRVTRDTVAYKQIDTYLRLTCANNSLLSII